MYHNWTIIVYINHDLLIMTYFMARSFWSHRRLTGKKVKTLDFSGSFVARDMKVERYRKHIEIMKSCEYSSSRWPKVIYILNVKLNFLRNRLTNQSHVEHPYERGI